MILFICVFDDKCFVIIGYCGVVIVVVLNVEVNIDIYLWMGLKD